MSRSSIKTCYGKSSSLLSVVFATGAIFFLLASIGCSKSGSADAAPDSRNVNGQAFDAGRERVKERDYEGAIRAFESELRSHPGNADAHLEVAVLYHKRVMDYAAAIYHYEHFLTLNPDTSSRASIEKSVEVCKRNIASSVDLEPSSFAMQKHVTELTRSNESRAQEIKQLTKENASLMGDISTLTGEIAKLAAEVQRIKQQGAMQYAASLQNGNGDKTPGMSPEILDSILQKYTMEHTIQSGDSLWGIAKKYNIDLSLLKSANPEVRADRIRPGDVLNIPKKPGTSPSE